MTSPHKIGAVERMQVIDVPTKPATTYTPKRIRLTTLRDCRRELTRLYGDLRRGIVSSADGSRMAFVLDRVRQCIESESLEARVAALEVQGDE